MCPDTPFFLFPFFFFTFLSPPPWEGLRLDRKQRFQENRRPTEEEEKEAGGGIAWAAGAGECEEGEGGSEEVCGGVFCLEIIKVEVEAANKGGGNETRLPRRKRGWWYTRGVGDKGGDPRLGTQ